MVYYCKFCGKKFEDTPNKKRKFCSWSCGNRARGQKGIKRAKRELRQCAGRDCNKMFECRVKQTKRYCSQKCYRKNRGAANPTDEYLLLGNKPRNLHILDAMPVGEFDTTNFHFDIKRAERMDRVRAQI